VEKFEKDMSEDRFVCVCVGRKVEETNKVAPRNEGCDKYVRRILLRKPFAWYRKQWIKPEPMIPNGVGTHRLEEGRMDEVE